MLIQKSLENLKLKFSIEMLIDNAFAVDFLIDEKIVLEANGFTHYY